VRGEHPTTVSESATENESVPAEPRLIRGVGLVGATTLNMIDMIGVGPFVTIPLIVAAAGGPPAMIGWVVGAVLVICDGLV
jgi:amino acid transporter